MGFLSLFLTSLSFFLIEKENNNKILIFEAKEKKAPGYLAKKKERE